jgi:hypothetical protein
MMMIMTMTTEMFTSVIFSQLTLLTILVLVWRD